MTEEQARALYEADRLGVRQLIGLARDDHGGYCAMGWLDKGCLLAGLWETTVESCPLCGATTQTYWNSPIDNEWCLIVHYNNDHRMTFSEIARKLGPDGV